MKKTPVAAVLALTLLGGCAYLDAKDDVRNNNQLIQQSKDEQQAEEDKRAGLRAEQEDVMNAQTEVSADLNKELDKLDAQQRKLASLRTSSKSSKQKAAALQNRLGNLKSDYSDASMQAQAATSPADVAARQAKLQQLKKQIDAAAKEVDALAN